MLEMAKGALQWTGYLTISLWIEPNLVPKTIVAKNLGEFWTIGPVTYRCLTIFPVELQIINERTGPRSVHEVIQVCRFMQENSSSVIPRVEFVPLNGALARGLSHSFIKRDLIEELIAERNTAIPERFVRCRGL